MAKRGTNLPPTVYVVTYVDNTDEYTTPAQAIYVYRSPEVAYRKATRIGLADINRFALGVEWDATRRYLRARRLVGLRPTMTAEEQFQMVKAFLSEQLTEQVMVEVFAASVE